MSFFKTDEGRLHIGRFSGVVLVVGFIPGCRTLLKGDPLCWMRIVFAAGWWLCCGTKRPARTLSEMGALGIIGFVLMALGAAGQFYVIGRHVSP